jgi:hypothetical protein
VTEYGENDSEQKTLQLIPQFWQFTPKDLTALTQKDCNIKHCSQLTMVKMTDNWKHSSLFHNFGKLYQKAYNTDTLI